jgi:acylphosphatase
LKTQNEKSLIRRHSYKIVVKGKVQGVGYRFNAQAKAHQLDLTGFVKNTFDENVLIHVEGAETAINAFIEWCYVGPRYAEVSEVNAEEQELMGYQTFEIKR